MLLLSVNVLKTPVPVSMTVKFASSCNYAGRRSELFLDYDSLAGSCLAPLSSREAEEKT